VAPRLLSKEWRRAESTSFQNEVVDIMKSLACFLGCALPAALLFGCSSDEGSTPGGTRDTGGSTGVGGQPGVGGSPGGGQPGGSAGEGGSGAEDGGSGPDGGAGADGSGGAGGAGGAGGSGGAEVGASGFPGWKYTKSIKMDTTPSGAGVTGNVASYPVAVILTGANFDFAQAKAQGEDIRFGKADGTPIPYAMESFDSAAKTAIFWVSIDQVLGNDATQSFKMYFGNASAGNASDSKKVFSTAGGFLGVWHLAEDGASVVGGFKDASETGADATGVNLMPGARVPGLLGSGTKMLNAMRQWVKVDDDTKRFRPLTMTASIWGWADGFPAKWSKDSIPGYQTIYSSGEAWTIQRETGGKFECCVNQDCGIGKAMNTKEWTLFTMVRKGDGHELFMNGASVSKGGNPDRADPKPLGIGQQTQYLDPVKHAGEQRSWEGILDEARVMSVAVDTNWIKLDYESQKPGSKFLSFGATETR
jgi:hypothetical protein